MRLIGAGLGFEQKSLLHFDDEWSNQCAGPTDLKKSGLFLEKRNLKYQVSFCSGKLKMFQVEICVWLLLSHRLLFNEVSSVRLKA